ncbi:MAG TPA: LysR substrate-binding domain-containing protein [Burkholderiaceae bacterium]|nr:LysR substrate-binding domain-containing protein [Burkholderiaceae bacterium]
MPTPLVRLHSLDLVRGFVAVGRRMSITQAAEELCLTQSAVSRQVAALEETLGVKLLVRGHRSISFTAEGERFFRVADAALQQLQDVWETLDRHREKRPVTITASTGVAGLWLLPRLGALHAAHPDLDVRIAANNRLMDLRTEDVDLAIRYCPAHAAPEGAVRLFGEQVVPVAHPSLALAGVPAREAVERHVLLEFDDPKRPWLQWADTLQSLGLGRVKPRGVLRFNQYEQVIHAAAAGQGIALGRRALVASHLLKGRLEVLPWAPALEHEYAYWLIVGEAAPRHDVARVARWIEEEARGAAR